MGRVPRASAADPAGVRSVPPAAVRNAISRVLAEAADAGEAVAATGELDIGVIHAAVVPDGPVGLAEGRP